MTDTYTIQEIAEITQVSPHTLRFYERIGLLHVARGENGYRSYSDNDLGWIRFIILLRSTDMSLPDIATFMKLEKDGQTTIDKRLDMLETHRHDLVTHIAELQGYLSSLDAKIDYYRQTSAEVCDCVGPEEEGVPERSSTGLNSYHNDMAAETDEFW
ncbi:MAG: MerR family transcriptional regulator [Chloroflexota bacterium]